MHRVLECFYKMRQNNVSPKCKIFSCIKSYRVLLCLFVLNAKCQAKRTHSIKCHNKDIQGEVADISDEFDNTPTKNSIFFHETTCHPGTNFAMIINARQACAVESAARLHPNRTIYLLFSSAIRYPDEASEPTRGDKMIQELMNYVNVKIRRVSFYKYVQGTPLDEWNMESELTRASNPALQASNVLRFLTMWKYGGTFLDLDVVLMKNLDSLGHNYVSRGRDGSVYSFVMDFDLMTYGKELAEECLREIRSIRKTDWSLRGPKILENALENLCRDDQLDFVPVNICEGVRLLNASYFNPIALKSWQRYFDSGQLDKVLAATKNSYGIHLWNSVSRRKVVVTSEEPVAYGLIAERFCPNIYRESGSAFY